MDNSRKKKVHFVGIGGAGMSGIAKVLLEKGVSVSGSDIKESQNTLSLRKQGAEVFIGHDAKNVSGADIVVYSSAISEHNPELKEAKRKGISLYPRGKMLAKLAEKKTTIAVAGTHGKTTTTSMISLALKGNNLSPTFLIGGELNDIGANAEWGKDKYVVTETDESDGSLLMLRPQIAVITNIEADHLDYFQSFAKIKEIFTEFISLVPDDGQVVICGDYPSTQEIIKNHSKCFVTYGLKEDNQFVAKNIKLGKFSSQFDVYKKKKKLGKVKLKTPGVHNVLNALAAVCLGEVLGLDVKRTISSLAKFSGVKRRFQLVSEKKRVVLVDDYAHHPTEIKATLKAASQGNFKRVVCVFQPHRFTRTKFLGQEFGAAFDEADLVVLTDVYSAGEEPILGVSGKLIADALLERSPRKEVAYLPRKEEIKDYLLGIAKEGDLILTMGAGDIWQVGEEFSKNF